MKHEADALHVGGMNECGMGEGALALGFFLGKYVTLESVLALHFSGAGYFEPFFCTGIAFHFRHFSEYDFNGCLTFFNFRIL